MQRTNSPLKAKSITGLPEPDDRWIATAKRALEAAKLEDIDGVCPAHAFLMENIPQCAKRNLFDGIFESILPSEYSQWACQNEVAAEVLINAVASNLTLKMQWDA